MARKLAATHGLGDHEVIVARSDLEAVQDRIALLHQAIGDIERERSAGGELADLAEAHRWLMAHAQDVAALRVEPVWSDRAGLT